MRSTEISFILALQLFFSRCRDKQTYDEQNCRRIENCEKTGSSDSVSKLKPYCRMFTM